MIEGARRGRRKPAAGMREAALPPSSDRGEGTGEVFLRLAIAQGSLGLESTRALALGPVELTEISVRLLGVRFPVDLSGGVRRFRHVRGQVARARLELPLAIASAALLDRVRRAAPTCDRLVLSANLDGLTVGLAGPTWALAFDCVAAPDAVDLRLVLEDARGEGLDAPAHVLACRVVDAACAGLASRHGGAFVLQDPVRAAARLVLPDAGARVPATEGLQLTVGVSDDGRAGRVTLTAERGAAPPQLSMRAVRALEHAELLAEADHAAFVGELERARAAYLEALERAPRHLEAARRLAALDLAIGEREAAAYATLSEVASVSDAGLLGSVVLEAMGEVEAAYAAASRAAADEPFGALAARAWTRAARLAPTRAAAAAALDEALVRSPGYADARWARIEARLATGDARGALGDVEHLEANTRSKHERHEVLRRAADRFFDRGLTEDAERLFERALRYEPKSARAVAGLARALRDRGRTSRALDLFARAAGLARREPDVAHEIELELARALAVYAGDKPSAVAHAAAIPQDAAVAPEARLFEATMRRDLGDQPGAARALHRLRALAETVVSEPTRARLEPALLEAATLDESLGDARAARRDLELALHLAPHSRVAARRLTALVRQIEEAGRPATQVDRPPATREIERPLALEPSVVQRASEPEADDEPDESALAARADSLTARLRADPSDVPTALELAGVLERLGRDLELFALLSARIEESPDTSGPLLELREAVLRRLAEQARREGRAGEASLYEDMLSR
jgi:hypothetical protein